ncbi:MAG: 4-(cytidine 5'-diphospho)-2-C-methyl-D-erythritol kinase [Elusimicrobia bacterium]|jgi:4-diphosphocytidyl-2-C-methyl-D-erythritol kinase|nr:4-(cytidine 5'-diphospho)-2-C-methyl-D-erythritol kinase [Elusimicrobiota bacterium]MBK8125280.1 4-(cytidine 5'-diphospho)-2-C-methyl-D-erythritol kinase [Elusimicrobiota bacterium]MBK8424034.1 4-(cytidine 5'-diphospho)-2-C-methyl-D-erythritol kinase [Elusimicrobiota bacterium]MBK8651683.1 4-(cytidine 5'-diphospho)-2-C-methyl-D-erythritol kinase [Elusimicrobiota bacterium]MBL0249840.1 4-(cytidine 5'-diphospho)-2-C-methyl-D-erythritol kinase [Elusimicrobiota bacterium]
MNPSLHSPAKINLFLEILRRRADGYHTLDSVFQEISLGDRLRATPRRDGRVVLSCDDPSLPVDERNLVRRAADAWTAARGPVGVTFRLTKRIPVGAGLGGGSGNAATALRALNALSRARAPVRALARIARGLGADVPFFLRGGLARAGGVGEVLTPLPTRRRRPLWFVLVFPRVFSSTAEAYRALRFPLTARRSCLKLTRALRAGEPPRLWASWLFNRLEEVVVPRLGPVAEAKRALVAAGALTALMSGSGSSVFGPVDDAAHGRRVKAALPRSVGDVWLVRSVDRP